MVHRQVRLELLGTRRDGSQRSARLRRDSDQDPDRSGRVGTLRQGQPGRTGVDALDLEGMGQAMRGNPNDSPEPPSLLEYRVGLLQAGFCPLPLYGKAVAVKGWTSRKDTNAAELRLWTERTFADATNTGILTYNAPALDIDIMNPEAAEAVEALVRGRIGDAGRMLVRTGKAPKRAVLFRTDTPFKKIQVELINPDGSEPRLGEKHPGIEFLCDGQQVVVDGIHPDTGKPYSWHGGKPGDVLREDLPAITVDEAQRLVDDVIALLINEFGFECKTAGRQGQQGGDLDFNNAKRQRPFEAYADSLDNWAIYLDNLIDHNNNIKLAAALVSAGMAPRAAMNFMRAAVSTYADRSDPDKFQRRLDEIKGMVETAVTKYAAPAEPPKMGGACLTIGDWLARDLPEPDYLLGDWLTTTSRVLLYGPTGLGKTLVGMAFSMRAAATMEFLHWSSRRPCKVLYIDGEMSRRTLKRRLAAEFRRMGCRENLTFYALSREGVE